MSELPEHLDLASMDIAVDKRQALLELLPEVRTEDGNIDFDRLKLALGGAVDVGRERYGMTWPGKAECFKTIQAPSLATLRPCPEESVHFDRTQNLIIDGDNLEVLKLLQKAYLGEIKMIYIDPPYNTGNDFIYPDNFNESLQTYLQYTGQVDAEGRRFGTNQDSDGRFHSKWLNMMYPRLYLARNLLRHDGVIFVSIDDNEIHNLRAIMDMIFGEENFITTIIWQKVYAPKNTARHFSADHDYIVVYARDSDRWSPKLLPRSDAANARYSNPDNDPRGPWKSSDMTARNYYSKGTYEVTSPSGKTFKSGIGRYWRQSHEKFLAMDANNEIWWGPDGSNMPAQKRFLSDVMNGLVPQTLWKYEEVGHTQEAKKELLSSVSFRDTENVLNSVKPTRLIQRMLQIGTAGNGSELVLDFFSGSAATAHAVLKQNAADGGDRRFICVQLPEPLPNPEPSLRTIADMGKQRMRHVGGELQTLDTEQLLGSQSADCGFRVFKLAESNFTPWNASLPEDNQALEQQLEMHVDHVLEGREQSDLLYEVLLKSGFPLSVPVEQLSLEGGTVHSIAGGALFICLEPVLTLEIIRAMAALQPERVVCLDGGFAGNDQLKTNAVLTFRDKGVAAFRTV